GPQRTATYFDSIEKLGECPLPGLEQTCPAQPDDRYQDGGSEMKRKGTIIKARETVLAAGKRAAERTKVLAGEVANAAATAGATAKAASTAAANVVLDTVATAIQARAVKGANALGGEGATTSFPAKKKVTKKVAAKKRAAPKKKANTKKKSRKVA